MKAELLTIDEERRLGKLALSGDIEARNRLVEANLGLVGIHIKNIRLGKTKLTWGDVFNEGCLGLIRAAEKFDPDMGFRFSTYASRWIRSFARRYVIEARKPIGYPEWITTDRSKIKAETRRQRKLTGVEPDAGDVMRSLRIGPIAQTCLALAGDIDKMHVFNSGGMRSARDKRAAVIDYADTREAEPEPDSQLLDWLSGAVGSITPRHGDIIRRVYGIGCVAMKQVDLAKELGVSPQRIRQINQRAMIRLRKLAQSSFPGQVVTPIKKGAAA